MKAKRTLVAAQLLFMFPAILFMGSLVVRQLSPLQYEPAQTAHRIVMWYAGKIWTLWTLLITLPLAVLIIGCITLLRGWGNVAKAPHRAQQLFVAMMTLTAGFVLAIVALHMGAN